MECSDSSYMATGRNVMTTVPVPANVQQVRDFLFAQNPTRYKEKYACPTAKCINKKPSLTVSAGVKGGVVVKCWHDCTQPEVLAALRKLKMDMSLISPNGKIATKAAKTIAVKGTARPDVPLEVRRRAKTLADNDEMLEYFEVERHIDFQELKDAHVGLIGKSQVTYPYFDEEGNYTGYKWKDVKTKQFGFKAADGATTKSKHLWPSYDLGPAEFVIPTEGEDDCLALRTWLRKSLPKTYEKYAVVTTGGGASTWDVSWGQRFAGMTVAIAYDSDEAGRTNAHTKVAPNIAPHAKEVRMLDLFPDRPDNDEGKQLPKDWIDWIELDGTKEGFQELIEDAELFNPYDFTNDPGIDVDIQKEARQQYIREHARLNLFSAGFVFPESTFTLREELAIEDEPFSYTVDGFHAKGHIVELLAPSGFGKTTLEMHLMKCLCDDEPFLGRYAVNFPDGRVGIWNYEMHVRTWRHWVRQTGIVNDDRACVLQLKGNPIPLLTPAGQDGAVAWLVEHEVQYWIIDTRISLMDSLNLNENETADMGQLVNALERIKTRAEIEDLNISVHIGLAEQEAGKERARGASRWTDFIDDHWAGTMQDEKRFLRGWGRIDPVPEAEVLFNSVDRSLSVGGGNRGQVRVQDDIDRVVNAVGGKHGMNTTQLKAAVGIRKDKENRASIAIREAIRIGAILTEKATGKGKGRAVLHYPNPEWDTVRKVEP